MTRLAAAKRGAATTTHPTERRNMTELFNELSVEERLQITEDALEDARKTIEELQEDLHIANQRISMLTLPETMNAATNFTTKDTKTTEERHLHD